jgi:hypothetical protein
MIALASWRSAQGNARTLLCPRFVIGEEALSSTSRFNVCRWAIFSAAIKSFILVLLLGKIGSYVM